MRLGSKKNYSKIKGCFRNIICYTHIDFRINDVDETAQNDDEVKHVPRVSKVILQCLQFNRIKLSSTDNLLFLGFTRIAEKKILRNVSQATKAAFANTKIKAFYRSIQLEQIT